MKRIIVLRFPLDMPAVAVKENIECAMRILGNEFIVLPIIEKVDKSEVQIVFDPHMVSTAISTVSTLTGDYKFVEHE